VVGTNRQSVCGSMETRDYLASFNSAYS